MPSGENFTDEMDLVAPGKSKKWFKVKTIVDCELSEESTAFEVEVAVLVLVLVVVSILSILLVLLVLVVGSSSIPLCAVNPCSNLVNPHFKSKICQFY